MSLFQRLAGDTDSFAFSLAFERDPDAGKGATLEESASWGSFEIWTGGRNLCAHWESGDEVSSVSWYLLPLLEWLTGNWDYLWHEVKFPVKATSDDAQSFLTSANCCLDLSANDEDLLFEWMTRHSLLACCEGGLFPDVVLRRLGASIEVSWGESQLPGTPGHYRFFESRGKSLCDPALVTSAVHAVLSDAASFLRAQCPDSPRIGKLIAALEAMKSPDRRVGRVSLLAGLGRTPGQMLSRWNSVVDRVTSFLKDKAQVLTVPPSEDLAVIGSCDAAMMFGAVSPSLTENDILLLADILAHSYSEGGEPAALQRYANISPYESAGEPWIAGYELADEFLDKLDADKVDYAPQGWVDVERIANILDVGIRDVELADHELRGASFAGKDHVPQVLLNRSHATSSYPSGRRFSVAHELAHVLHDRLYANRLAIISGPWAPPAIEKRANAFAAMLLMPKRLLDRHRAQFANLSPESISKLADILAVSHTALIHHLKNIGRLDEGTAEAFLASVCTR